MSARLFDVAKKQRWRGSRALVAIPRDSCPRCLGKPSEVTQTELALFRHGGYGAARATTWLHCGGCGWSLLVRVVEVNPRRVA